ncbi:O-antigen ligase family protein [Thermanaeromonas sp. C210]|uniref:O-antigen ligase family protein n=1 Tax=Thermanaeromonas sp. C210 TaxID=2731925 RepID=UPI00155BFAD9|nr:O-antigen ligase family protein [Thermanaeromonas sp. C210]GFN23699.1 O-antigen polymerase [Thermanaeromonas sp. C210]
MGRKALYGTRLLNVNLKPFTAFAFLILLTAAPLSRGLFFPSEYLVAYQLVAVIFTLVALDRLNRREGLGPFSVPDYLPLAMAGMYLLSLVVAVNKSGAAREALEALSLCLLFWSVSRYIQGIRDVQFFLRAIFLSSLIVSLVGLGAAAGLVEFPGAYEGGVIHSTLQYRNALAAFLAASQIVGLYLWLFAGSTLGRGLLGPANLILTITLILTQSRGGWILYFLALAVWFAGLPRERLVRGFYQVSFNALIAMAASRSFWLNMAQSNGYGPVKVLGFYLALSCAVSLAMEVVSRGRIRLEMTPVIRNMVVYGGAIYILAVLVIYLVYVAGAVPRAAAQFLPAPVVQRAATISGTDPSFVGRIAYYKDALELIRRHPWLGTGGGGWNALYHRYQESQYFSSEVHNHFLQVWVETGPIGATVFALIWVWAVICLLRLWRRFRRERDDLWPSAWSASIGALTLGVHSFFDFDFSLPAMGMVAWCLLGVLRGRERLLQGAPSEIQGRRLLFQGALSLVLAGALLGPAYSFYQAGVIGAEGARNMAEGNYRLAKELLLKAERLDPFSASYPADLAQVNAVLGLAGDDLEVLEESVVKAKRAVRLEPYNPKVRVALSFAYMIQGLVDQGVAEARALIDINPLDVTAYEHLGRTYIAAARYYLEQREIYMARPYIQKARQLPDLVQARAKQVSPGRWQGPRLEVTPVINLVAGQAAYLEGQYQEAISLLQAARKQAAIAAEAMVWEAAASFKAGQEDLAQKLLNEARAKDDRVAEYYRRLLALKPVK